MLTNIKTSNVLATRSYPLRSPSAKYQSSEGASCQVTSPSRCRHERSLRCRSRIGEGCSIKQVTKP